MHTQIRNMPLSFQTFANAGAYNVVLIERSHHEASGYPDGSAFLEMQSKMIETSQVKPEETEAMAELPTWIFILSLKASARRV